MKTNVPLKMALKVLCRIVVCFILAGLAMIGTILVPRPAGAATGSGVCQSYNVPVALSEGQPQKYSIYGELCNPTTGASQTIQLLIPGGTYGHIYWDFPYEPQNYSYVRAANAAGYSTFNIDRIGTGQSSHPDLAVVTVTMGTNAYAVHQVVQDLRAGQIGGQAFARIVLVGHSLGSVTAWIEAGTYQDVDGAIITGLVHHINAIQLASILTTLYPAVLDADFASDKYGVNYVTTEPGTRGSDFYYVPGADPNVIVLDEATKQTATSGEFATFADSLADDISAHIIAPVLVVVGQQDAIACGLLATNCSSAAAVQSAEAPYYCSQAQLQVAVIPGAGHDINLHKTAPDFFAVATAWMNQHAAP